MIKGLVNRLIATPVDAFNAVVGVRDELQNPSCPIRLFWAREIPNFGDSLSYDVVQHLADRHVEWAPIAGCNMIAAGSVLPWLRESVRRRRRVVHVWGSGTLQLFAPQSPDAGLRIHAVRGPLTASIVARGDVAIGDPGLLAQEVFGMERGRSTGIVGLVAHYIQSTDASFRKSIPECVRLIDPRNLVAREVVEQIAGCDFIFSSSLHGLIVADSLGIPKERLKNLPLSA